MNFRIACKHMRRMGTYPPAVPMRYWRRELARRERKPGWAAKVLHKLRLVALLLCLALVAGCAVRTPEGYEVSVGDARGGGSAASSATPPAVPSAAARATYAADAQVDYLLVSAAAAAARLDWTEFRQRCADAMAWAWERMGHATPAGGPATFAALAGADVKATGARQTGTHENAAEAWKELER